MLHHRFDEDASVRLPMERLCYLVSVSISLTIFIRCIVTLKIQKVRESDPRTKNFTCEDSVGKNLIVKKKGFFFEARNPLLPISVKH